MMQWKEISALKDSQFQRLTGVKRKVFESMLDVVAQHRKNRSTRRGRPSTVSLEDQLLIMLMYYREYRTFLHISITYNISETQCWRIVRKTEDVLIKSKLFHLPGKKKRHTLKTQIVVEKLSKKIICTNVAKGRKHDFRIFKESKVMFLKTTQSLTDSGYQGIQKIHSNCLKPIKGTKKRSLSSEEKQHNHGVGSKRVMVEHTIRKMKIFKILSYPYRNRRKRFALRVNLIAAIYNFEL